MPRVWDVETITIILGWCVLRVWDVETITIMQGWCVLRVWDVETITIMQAGVCPECGMWKLLP